MILLSHVILNFVYRLKMYSIERSGVRGLARRVLGAILGAPNYFDRLWSSVCWRVLDGVWVTPSYFDELWRGVYGNVLDGVQVVPSSGASVEARVSHELLGPEASLRVPREIATRHIPSPREGLVQKSVRCSSLTESLAVGTALFASLSLQRIQGSLERSVLTSSLLAGSLVTIALLFLALYHA